jgi:AbrB family looped-hinge helix DNA binding protein
MKKGYVTAGGFYAHNIDMLKYDLIAVPKEVLEKLELKSGDEVEIRTYKDRISIKKQEKNE